MIFLKVNALFNSVGEPCVLPFLKKVQTFSLSQQEQVTYLATNEKEAVRRL